MKLCKIQFNSTKFLKIEENLFPAAPTRGSLGNVADTCSRTNFRCSLSLTARVRLCCYCCCRSGRPSLFFHCFFFFSSAQSSGAYKSVTHLSMSTCSSSSFVFQQLGKEYKNGGKRVNRIDVFTIIPFAFLFIF